MKRKEHDFIGDMDIDDALYYGIQTLRTMRASQVTGHSIGAEASELLYYLAAIKKAAALAHRDTGHLPQPVADALALACEEVMSGLHSAQFPVDMLTGGGGIGVNMNMNEVLAHRANELLTGHKGYDVVHPNTHVNMGQSTNDVLPAAMHLALHQWLHRLINETTILSQVFSSKSQEHSATVKIGRTCLQDALPVTLGQELSAHAAFLQRQLRHLRAVAEDCLTLPLGGTAVGTGVGTLPGVMPILYAHLAGITGLKVRQDDNFFDALQHADLYSRISYCLKALASGVSKMAADFRLLASGPYAGMGELTLPELLPGSSIMPGKINPVLPELMMQIYFQICGHDVAVSLAVERGELDLNVWESLIYKCLSESCRLLVRGLPLFATDCVAGLGANAAVCRAQAGHSLALAAPIAAVFGYETGSEVARAAQEQCKTIAAVVVEKGLLDAATAAELLDPILLTSAERSQNAIRKLKDIVQCRNR